MVNLHEKFEQNRDGVPKLRCIFPVYISGVYAAKLQTATRAYSHPYSVLTPYARVNHYNLSFTPFTGQSDTCNSLRMKDQGSSYTELDKLFDVWCLFLKRISESLCLFVFCF